MIPWPANCKIWQTAEYCNTYEIADTGEYIASCDIAMIRGECLVHPDNRKKDHCLEYCPEEGCVKEEFARMLKMAASTMVLLIAYIWI